MEFPTSAVNKYSSFVPVLGMLGMIGGIYYTFIFGWALVVPTTLSVVALVYTVASMLFMIIWSFF